MHFLLIWSSGSVQRDQNMVKMNVTITRKHNINSHAICRRYVMPINCKKKQTNWINYMKSAIELKNCCNIMRAYKHNAWTWCGNHKISPCVCFLTLLWFILQHCQYLRQKGITKNDKLETEESAHDII
jgi:hypothetical protein